MPAGMGVVECNDPGESSVLAVLQAECLYRKEIQQGTSKNSPEEPVFSASHRVRWIIRYGRSAAIDQTGCHTAKEFRAGGDLRPALAHETAYARFNGRLHHIWTGDRHVRLATLR